MPSIQERVAILEERLKSPTGKNLLRNVVIGVLLTGSLSGSGFWVWYVTSNIIAIKQQLADGGNKQIVAELKNPKSPELLRASLSTVIAQVQTAKAEGVKPNPVKTTALSQALGDLIERGSPPKETWKAASDLISYRSDFNSLSDGRACPQDYKFNDDLSKSAMGNGVRIDIRLSNCTLAIDDPSIPEYLLKISESARERRGILDKMPYVHYYLNNVHVVYGGKPIYATTITFIHCTFEFHVDSEPAPLGRQLFQQLLASNNLDALQLTAQEIPLS